MSWLSQALHSSGANSLLANLLASISALVEANNPKYAPIIQVTAQVAQAEIASLASGNAPSPHAPIQPIETPNVPTASSVTVDHVVISGT